MSYKIAKKFWKQQKQYPNYPNTKERRIIDINFVIDNIETIASKGGYIESVLDLGCADGYLLFALNEKTNIKNFYGYDISKKLLPKSTEDIKFKLCDFTKIKKYPKVDMSLSMGMFPYIFENNDLYNIISKIKSKMLLVRSPCTLKSQDEYINKYSKELKNNYSCVYRTCEKYIDIFKKFYINVDITKAYPDNIESKYGTKHYYFVCKGKL